MVKKNLIHIGTAGWSIPANMRDNFPAGDSLLERYSQVFNAAEINSSFYRPHQKTTYERWAEITPKDFQFAVKMPKQITHNSRLKECEAYLDAFIDETSGLQTKLGPLLIQLPPSLSFESKIADNFFSMLRDKFTGKVVVEPRHDSWGKIEAITLLQEYNIVSVIADPVRVSAEGNKLPYKYYRLHGSPKIYSSSYSTDFLEQLAQEVKNSSWVIFDNTQFGAATQNALDLKKICKKGP